jgi:antitoxin HicB
MDYPVRLERDGNDTILVTFPDFPEAHSFGDDEADALLHARDVLATVLEAYIKDRRPIPRPSRHPRATYVAAPALIEAKVKVYEAMRATGIGKAELARRLQWHMPQVDRVLDLRHNSKLDQVEAAATVLGKRIVVNVEDMVSTTARVRPRKATGTRPARSKRTHARRARASVQDCQRQR